MLSSPGYLIAVSSGIIHFPFSQSGPSDIACVSSRQSSPLVHESPLHASRLPLTHARNMSAGLPSHEPTLRSLPIHSSFLLLSNFPILSPYRSIRAGTLVLAFSRADGDVAEEWPRCFPSDWSWINMTADLISGRGGGGHGPERGVAGWR
jgi:hypothetical protein